MEVLPAMEEAAAEQYDLSKEVKKFQESKAGVKGLVDDSGTLLNIPRMFVHKPEDLPESSSGYSIDDNREVPVIDLSGLQFGRRKETVDAICEASETWGLFQLINHGIPANVMDGLLESQKRFHEQPKEVKMELYSYDSKRKVRFYSNQMVDESRPANWRDTIVCEFPDDALEPEAIPIHFRKEMVEYMKCMMKIREVLSQLLSEALGLSSDYLSQMECLKSETLVCHYYPPCPEPLLTLGINKHSDPDFLTILLQDSISALQVLHQDQWIDVPPIKGALVANLGDLMQLITNDKFKSVEHRVLANSLGPRLSAACFFNPSSRSTSKLYGPIKELLSESEPPVYRGTLVTEYLAQYPLKRGSKVLQHFLISSQKRHEAAATLSSRDFVAAPLICRLDGSDFMGRVRLSCHVI